MLAAVNTMHPGATPASIQNCPCHPVMSMSTPPSSGPAAAPTATRLDAVPLLVGAGQQARPGHQNRRPGRALDDAFGDHDPAGLRDSDEDARRDESIRPSWKARLRPKTSPSEPDVTITAAPTSEQRVTARSSVVTDIPVSSERSPEAECVIHAASSPPAPGS